MKNKVKFRVVFGIIMLLMSVSAYSQTVIQMEKEGGVYKIPCEINGLRLKLIFDTGASNVCISESIALMMLENGYLTREDIKGSSTSVVADGRIVENTKINIKTLKIGGETLNNVEAVVMHQQAAPLLLGQSAIQKLGKISISGDKLILSKTTQTYQTSAPQKESTFDEVWKAISLTGKANEAFDNSLYELAAQYYSDSYKLCNLSLDEKEKYAYCLRVLDKYDEALAVYKDIKSDSNKVEFENKDIDFQANVYFGMQVCYFELADYKSSILAGQMVLPKINFDNSTRNNIVYFIAMSYDKNGDTYTGKQTFLNEINSYLAYMEISATDCWDKGYKDPYIAQLYYSLSFISEDVAKYIIISAAWGHKKAIETAKEYSLSYHQKPSKYEY